MNIKINYANPSLDYAKLELERYLLMIDKDVKADISFEIKKYDNIDPIIKDIVEVNIDNMCGKICGSNSRSVLFGVYTLLKAIGCMWVRPGKSGEFIPQKTIGNFSYKYYKKADYDFRGECIEGAPSYYNIMDTIDWLPKVNMNLFMIEQVVPYNYISRWYFHTHNSIKEKENVTFEDVSKFIPQFEKEISKRGLQLHTLGHGYLLEPYDIHYSVRSADYYISPKAHDAIALVKGKRDLYNNSPCFTQLCMSKDYVRQDVINYLIDYTNQKPEVDFLHIWLADTRNNHCECENCVKKSPTDWYIILLNELDARLTAEGKDTKIVFIMYTATYWAPEKEKFNNPDRFILTTAATGRDYNKPYSGERAKSIPTYIRNQIRDSVQFQHTMKYMDNWKPYFDGNKFLFEYRTFTDHYKDPGTIEFAKGMYNDVLSLDGLGFNGIMQDGTHRLSFPTALGRAIQADTLFDTSIKFDSYCDCYFEKAFGKYSKQVREYLEGITKLFNPFELRNKLDVTSLDTGEQKIECTLKFYNNTKSAERFEKIEGHISNFKDIIAMGEKETNECIKESFRLLKYHAKYCSDFASVYLAIANGDIVKAKQNLTFLINWLSEVEDYIQPDFDLFLFAEHMPKILMLK